MTRRLLIAASLCVAVLMTYQVNSAAEKKSPLKGVNCFLKKTKDGKPIPVKAACAVAYKGATVYFCCGGCKGKFSKDAKCRAANAHNANHQLAATGQAKLAKCVFTGKKLNPATKMSEVRTMPWPASRIVQRTAASRSSPLDRSIRNLARK